MKIDNSGNLHKRRKILGQNGTIPVACNGKHWTMQCTTIEKPQILQNVNIKRQS